MNIVYTMSATVTAKDLFKLLGIPCGPYNARIRWREITITPILKEPTHTNNQERDKLDTEMLRVELRAFRPNSLPKRPKHV